MNTLGDIDDDDDFTLGKLAGNALDNNEKRVAAKFPGLDEESTMESFLEKNH
jgi:hypothetical protein